MNTRHSSIMLKRLGSLIDLMDLNGVPGMCEVTSYHLYYDDTVPQLTKGKQSHPPKSYSSKKPKQW